MFPKVNSNSINIKLEAGVLIALADLTTISHRIAERTALTGSAEWLDILLLAPGIHLQQQAASMANAGGETPRAAAINNGYIFSIENQAMVGYLQRVGVSGMLTNIHVQPVSRRGQHHDTGPASRAFYLLAIAATLVGTAVLVAFREWWTVGSVAVLMLTRAANVHLIRQRAQVGFTGAKEPGVVGDILILLSQDRWVRLRGQVDDIKAVTAGQWLRDMDTAQSFTAGTASLLVYMTAAVSANSSIFGNLVLVGVLLVEVALLSLSNKLVRALLLHERVVTVERQRMQYTRRKDMAIELVVHSGRSDWALGLGLLQQQDVDAIAADEKAKREKEGFGVVVQEDTDGSGVGKSSSISIE
ncbi:hypothetical protein DFH27DRAFT_489139 [Peziza echinospora]|nr:hypothetical protein DFH27DRAFT_489139 [Peziza echinospora]